MTRSSTPWIQTYTGRRHIIGAPNPDGHALEDIAHALSNICRFAGHAHKFYSVAQHSVLVASILPTELKAWGLLHDAAEAYTGDMPTPLKWLMSDDDVFCGIERRTEIHIANKYGLQWPMPSEVKRADKIILATEARDLMGGQSGGCWEINQKPIDKIIVPVDPPVAKAQFLAACEAHGIMS